MRRAQLLPIVVYKYLKSAVFEDMELVRVATLNYLRSAGNWVMQTLPTMLNYPIEERLALAGEDARVIILHGEHDYLVPTSGRTSSQPDEPCEMHRIPGAAHSTLYSDDDDVAKGACHC